MSLRALLRDERGATMVEMLAGMMAGTVVMAGLTTLVVVTLHTTTRVSARVDATQRARLTLNRVVDQLHSACVAPKIAPVKPGSTGTELRFVHATGKKAVPTPVLSVVKLEGTSLTQADYAYKEGSAPFWVFNSTPFRNTQLLTGVSQISATKPVFSYYTSSLGATNEVPLATPLGEFDASRTVHVGIAFLAHPESGPAAEEGTPSRMRGGATFRLSAVSYNEAAPSQPCQ